MSTVNRPGRSIEIADAAAEPSEAAVAAFLRNRDRPVTPAERARARRELARLEADRLRKLGSMTTVDRAGRERRHRPQARPEFA